MHKHEQKKAETQQKRHNQKKMRDPAKRDYRAAHEFVHHILHSENAACVTHHTRRHSPQESV